MTPEQIAAYYRQKGIELTPNEIREILKSIAAKFREVDPNLPENDDELFEKILGSNSL